jgi:prevent-host-death family protein
VEKYITATEANQRFSELLRDVSEGESYTVTSRGKPVARMVPADKKQSKVSLEELYAKWDARGSIVTGPWKREDLYDRSDRGLP